MMAALLLLPRRLLLAVAVLVADPTTRWCCRAFHAAGPPLPSSSTSSSSSSPSSSSSSFRPIIAATTATTARHHAGGGRKNDDRCERWRRPTIRSMMAKADEAESSTASAPPTTGPPVRRRLLFDESTLAEAGDALSSVGWSSPESSSSSSSSSSSDGSLTSDDPFVRLIDESVRIENGGEVGLDGLLNPAKVVNLERDLYNLRCELAAVTGVVLPGMTDADASASDPPSSSSPPPAPPLAGLATTLCDGGGGGEVADGLRSKIAKKEGDLAIERRSVFRSWLKTVFLGQAVISAALSYVMANDPAALFGGFSWYADVPNMDTSVTVLGFWWWWLFIVPSLRSRRPSGWEKGALDAAFLGTPLVSISSPILTKDTGIIWWANFVVVAGAYGFAYFSDGGGGVGGGDEEDRRPGWLKFVYRSLDFGSGRERGARK